MKKRICALLCALLMLVSFSCTVSATIKVENPDGEVYYDTDKDKMPKEPSAFSVTAKKVLEIVSNFWHRFGVVTVVVLLLVAIVAAIVISEFERQKKEGRPPQTKSKKKKKK